MVAFGTIVGTLELRGISLGLNVYCWHGFSRCNEMDGVFASR
jgi:hypothetical protein